MSEILFISTTMNMQLTYGHHLDQNFQSYQQCSKSRAEAGYESSKHWSSGGPPNL